MPLDRNGLIDFLKVVDAELEEQITIIAVGGTAMTLLELKSSTIDVDFDFPTKRDLEIFRRAKKIINPGFRIDVFLGSQIFSQKIPDDYEKIAIRLNAGFEKVSLFALHPLDIVVTKIGRLNDRDIEDIKTCIGKYRLTRKQVRQRGEAVEEAGNEMVYKENLEHVLKSLFVS